MNEKLKATLVELAAPAKPTYAQRDELVAGWTRYFAAMHISDNEQSQEFDGIMRARVRSGCMSLVAPEVGSHE